MIRSALSPWLPSVGRSVWFIAIVGLLPLWDTHIASAQTGGTTTPVSAASSPSTLATSSDVSQTPTSDPVATTTVATGQLSASSRPALPAQILRIDVPAERPQDWPAATRDWVPIPRSEFERWLPELRPPKVAGPTLAFEQARYRARFEAGTLQEGRFQWRLRNDSRSGQWATFGPLNLALGQLSWEPNASDDRSDSGALDVAAGTTSDGRWQVFVPPGEQTLTGAWTVGGDQYPSGVDFDLQIPAALSSEFSITAAQQLTLSTSAGVVSRPSAADADPAYELVETTINLGAGSHVRLSLQAPRATGDDRPTLLYESDATMAIAPDELRFQSTLQVEAGQGSVTELGVLLPEGADIYSVSYGDRPAKWKIVSEAANSHLRITLPEAVTGRLRPLRLNGILVARSGTSISIPRLPLIGGEFRSARCAVTVQSPLQVQSIRANGFRQLGPASVQGSGETFQFQQATPDATLVLEVRRPSASQSVHALSVLTGDEGGPWTLTTDWVWHSPNGSTFQINIIIPPLWEVSNVETLTADGPAELGSWDVQPRANGSSLLSIELLHAISPAAPRTLRLILRHPPLRPLDTFATPIPQAVGIDAAEYVLAVTGALAGRFNASNEPMLTATSAERLPTEVRKTPLWETLFANRRGEVQLLRGSWTDPPERPGRCTIDRPVSSGAPGLLVTVSGADRRLLETTSLTFEAGQRRARVLLPALAAARTWKVSQGPTDLTVSARRNDDASIPAALTTPPDPAASNAKPRTWHWWELELSASANEEVTIVSERPFAPADQVSLTLPHRAANSGEFSGVKRSQLFCNRLSSDWTVSFSGSGATVDPDFRPDLGPAGSVWSYDTQTQDVTLVRRAPTDDDEVLPVHYAVHGRSLLAAAAQADDLHEVTLSILQGSPHRLVLTLPERAVILRAVWDDLPITPVRLDRQQVELSGPGRGLTTVSLIYRTPCQVYWWGSPRQLAVPSIIEGIASAPVRWALAAAPQWQLLDWPADAQTVPAPSPLSWTARCFGPLGRGHQERIFDPFDASTWNDPPRGALPASSTLSAFPDWLRPPPGWQQIQMTAPPQWKQISFRAFDRTRWRVLQWLTILVTLLMALLIGRVATRTLLRRLLIVLLLAAWSAAWLLPLPAAPVAGAAAVGLLLALLFPWSDWRPAPVPPPDPTVPPGSTQSFQIRAAVQGTALVAISTGLVFATAQSWAQTVPDPSTGSSNRDARPVSTVSAAPVPEPAPAPAAVTRVLDELAILVPVDADGEPSRTLPLIYANPRLAALLEQRRAAETSVVETRLAQARYQLTGQGGDLEVIATLEVLTEPLAGDAAPARVRFPVNTARLRGRSICRVDGRPVPAQPTLGGLLIQVASEPLAGSAVSDLSAPRSLDTDSLPDNVVSALRPSNRVHATPSLTSAAPQPLSVPWQRHRIELELRLPLETSAELPWTSLPLPACHDSSLMLGSGSGLLEVRHPLANTLSMGTELPLGPITELAVRPLPATAGSTVANVDQVELSQRWLLDATSQRWDAAWELSGAVHGQPLKTFTMELPGRWLIHDETRSGARVFTRRNATGTTIVAEFAPPAERSFRLSFSGVPPEAEPRGALRLVLPQFDCQTHAIVQPGPASVAIAAIPDLRLNVAKDLIRDPASIDQFLEAWSGSRPRTRPIGVTPLEAADALEASVQLVSPVRRLTDLTAVGRLGLRKWDWSWTGRIEVTGTPVYSHSLLVDRRLKIDSLTVQEDGIERLARWSRVRQPGPYHRIVLFLNDRASSSQSLSLKASISAPAGRATDLPAVRFEDCELVSPQLVLYRDAEVDIDLSNVRGLDPIVLPPGWPSQTDGFELLRGYRISQLDWGTAARATPNAGRASIQSLVRAEQQDEQLALEGVVNVTPSGPAGGQIEFRVPESLIESFAFQIQPRPLATEFQRSTGLLTIDYAETDGTTEPFVLLWLASCPSVQAGAVRFPNVEPTQPAEYEAILALRHDSDWSAAPPTTREISRDRLAKWADVALGRVAPMEEDWRWFECRTTGLSLVAPAVAVEQRTARLMWVEHGLTLSTTGEHFGRTLLLFEAAPAEVHLQIPAEIELLACSQNGQSRPVPRAERDSVLVPIVGERDLQLVQLDWKRRGGSESWLPTELVESFPQVVGPTPEQAWIVVVPPAGSRVAMVSAGDSSNWASLSLERLKLLRGVLQQHGTRGTEWAKASFVETYRQMTQFLSDRLPTGEAVLASEQSHDWGELVSDVNRLEWLNVPRNSNADVPLLEWPGNAALPSRPLYVARWQASESTLRGWWWPSHAWLRAASTVLAIVALLLLVRSALFQRLTGLSPGSDFATLTLGLIWWLCLSPSIIGLAMIVYTVWHAWQRRRAAVVSKTAKAPTG